MDLITLIVTLAVIGFVLWVVVTYIPMPPPFKNVLIGLVVLLVIVWLARIIVGPLPHVGR